MKVSEDWLYEELLVSFNFVGKVLETGQKDKVIGERRTNIPVIDIELRFLLYRFKTFLDCFFYFIENFLTNTSFIEILLTFVNNLC